MNISKKKGEGVYLLDLLHDDKVKDKWKYLYIITRENNIFSHLLSCSVAPSGQIINPVKTICIIFSSYRPLQQVKKHIISTAN
jgi:hypothetical protein